MEKGYHRNIKDGSLFKAEVNAELSPKTNVQKWRTTYIKRLTSLTITNRDS